MTSIRTSTAQTLPEMLGNSGDWEIHIYTFPLYIDTIAPVRPERLLGGSHGVRYQRVTELAAISKIIEAFSGIPVAVPPSSPFVESRVLIEFRSKLTGETISLANDGVLMSFYVQRHGEEWSQDLPEIVFRDESRYRIVEQIYRDSLHSADWPASK